ncbi:MAG: Hydrogen cyanide synthase subunit HcnC precursor [Planctomycetota bacterium]
MASPAGRLCTASGPRSSIGSAQRFMGRRQSDILLIGGGVIGLTTAFELARGGVRVLVADRQMVGQEASWAGAGMLPPGAALDSSCPEVRLRSYSHGQWPELASVLRELTGRDTGYRVSGSVLLTAGNAEAERLAGQWVREGVLAEAVGGERIRELCPGLCERLSAGVWLPGQAQVRNPRHLRALREACELLGVEFLEEAEGLRLEIVGERVVSVTAGSEHLQAGRVCVTAGAWTAGILEQAGVRVPVFPVRGQMVQLRTGEGVLRCMLEEGKRYLVPRGDGLLLVGSTEEHLGFAKGNTAEGVGGLLEFAFGLVPALRGAELVRCWSGLRPGTADGLPLLGRVPGFLNLFVAAGHFRSGLQMSAGTGRIMADLLQDREPLVSLAGLQVDRFCESRVGGVGCGQ